MSTELTVAVALSITAKLESFVMSEPIVEHRFMCPYCWESITMLLDLSVDQQSYVEDCEVCCNPIAVNVASDDGALTEFSGEQMD